MREDPLFEWGAQLERPTWRAQNVATSELAAQSIPREAQLEIAWEVMCRWVRSMPLGLIDDQYGEERGEAELHSTYRKRRSELKNIGWLADPGKECYRKTRRGRLAVPWVVTEDGLAYYERGKAIFMAAYRRLKKPRTAPKGVQVPGF
jgi:hypothetical protein